MHLMTESAKKSLELFLHLESTVVSADGNQPGCFRTAPRHASNYLDSFRAHHVGSQRRQPSSFGDPQDRPVGQIANVIFGDNGL
jgi:hypothetical protein